MSILSGLFGRDQDGSVVIGVEMDNRGLEKGLSESTSAIERESKKWDKAGSDAADNIGGSFTSVFTKIATGAAMAKVGAALGKLAAESINLASDLQEVQNVVDVTFGDRATDIDTWAKNARTQFGLTETQAKQFASTLGAMFKSGGISDDNLLVQMSTDLAGLAADMASFYNLDFDEAFQKIQSGITGITQPLKSLGINMSESNLSAFAEANGQLYSAMSEAEKMVLRYQYLMSVTADAQGDFARTSDGFANQMRLIQTNIDALKTNLGTVLIPIVNTALQLINNLLEALATPAQTTVLDTFADIDAQFASRVAGIDAAAASAMNLVKVLRELNTTYTTNTGQTVSGEELFGFISEMEPLGVDVMAVFTEMGLNADEIMHDYAMWLETTNRLTDTIPGLTTVIDDETGALEGSIDAVEDYITAWQKQQHDDAIKKQIEQRTKALEDEKAALVGYELDAKSARMLADEARQAYENADLSQVTAPQLAALYAQWQLLERQAERAEATYSAKSDAIDDATDMLEANKRVAGEATDTTEDLADSMDELQRRVESGEVSIDALKKTLEALDPVVSRIGEIIKDTSEESIKDVDNVITGFGKIITPANKARDALKEVSMTNEDGSLNLKWAELNESIPTMSNMIAGLQSQRKFAQEYTAMLTAAAEMGVNADLLATLANGSPESYDLLTAIMNDPNRIGELNDEWAALEADKNAMAAVMTDTKLTADDEFQSLVRSAAEMIEDIDMADGAEAAMRDTVEGMVRGISDSVPELRQAVDSIVEQLQILNSLGYGTYYGDWFGGVEGLLHPDGSAAVGMDYVPYDNFLAQLHEGESVLTAEEARVWRDFRYGAAAASNSIDYDALGSTMRENAGGNVYLDGRIVGNVISSRQADSYRGLERSGWRG